MAKIHDLFIVELAEVIKGYGNNPDYEDPFRLSEFYRFYELPNIAVSRENFEKMRPAEPERKKGEWIDYSDEGYVECPFCHSATNCDGNKDELHYCFSCGAELRGEQE